MMKYYLTVGAALLIVACGAAGVAYGRHSSSRSNAFEFGSSAHSAAPESIRHQPEWVAFSSLPPPPAGMPVYRNNTMVAPTDEGYPDEDTLRLTWFVSGGGFEMGVPDGADLESLLVSNAREPGDFLKDKASVYYKSCGLGSCVYQLLIGASSPSFNEISVTRDKYTGIVFAADENRVYRCDDYSCLAADYGTFRIPTSYAD